MKSILLHILIVWFLLGSLHTAAMTAANVLVNRNLTFSSKLRYVVFGGPPVWLVCIFCLAAGGCMTIAYRWRNRHVEAAKKG